MSATGGTERFREEQQFRPWWMWIPLVLLVAFSLPIFSTMGALGWNWSVVVWFLLPTLVTVALSIAIMTVAILTYLETVVDDTSLRLRFWPLPGRRIALGSIRSAEAVTFQPYLRFGGWVSRWFPGAGRAYAVQGTLGVRIELTDGRRVMVGTQRPQELAAAIGRPRPPA